MKVVEVDCIVSTMKSKILTLKREAILDAAARLFSQRGYYNTTLDDIAAELGVSKPSIYNLYKNKSELLSASFTRVVDLCLEAIISASQATGSPTERLRELVERIVFISAENRPFNAVLLREEKSLEPEALRLVRVKEDAFHEALRALLAEGVNAGEFQISDIRIAALSIGGQIAWLYGGRDNIGEDEPEWVAEKVSSLVIQMVTGARV